MAKDPYNGQAPSESASGTSVAAARSVAPITERLERAVMNYIVSAGSATDDELEDKLGLRHQTASARRRTLELKGFIVKEHLYTFTGEKVCSTRRTRSGRRAQVYVMTREGLEAMRDA